MNGHPSALAVDAPARYVPGSQYTLSVQITNAQSATNGFELIGRKPAINHDRAGTLAAPNNKVQVDFQGYGKQTLSGSAQTSWSLTWTAPAAGFGNVRFYAAGNAANDDNTVNGDWIMTATADTVENLAPTAPSRNSPAANAVETTGTPALSVNAASDGNGDALTYTFQLCADAACGSVLETSPAVTGSSVIAWTPTVAGAENQGVYWRCRANDGFTSGPYMAASRFWVDAVAESPALPQLQQPATGSTVYTATPTIVATASADPDPFDLVDYEFTLATDAAFTSVVTFTTHLQGSGGQVAWPVPVSLATGSTYYVLVQAVDLLGNRSAASYASFTVDLTYVPPGTPVNLSPSAVTVATSLPTLTADAVTGTGTITYQFALDASGAFAPALRSAAGLAAPSFTVPGPALADGKYFWRTRAYDGVAYGEYAFASFFIEAVNDPPGAPTPAAPLDGAQVNTRTPVLQAGAAADPEGDTLAYRFELAANAGFTPVLQTSGALSPASDGTVSWTPLALENGKSYHWRVRAHDAAAPAVLGPYSAGFAFAVVNANLPPAAPDAADHEQVAVEPVALLAAVAPDPDGDPLTLRYELYADSKLSVPVTAAAALAPSEAWTPTAAWTPGVYYWRAQASDGFAAGPWSATAKLELTGPLPWTERELPAETRTHTEVRGGCASGGMAPAWMAFAAALLALRRVRRRALAPLLVLAIAAGCGTEESTVTESVPARADWAAVSEIFDTYCIGCHGGAKPEAGLTLEAGPGAIVGAAPLDPVARERGWLLVAPGAPERSFLLYKVTTPPLGAGDRMPQKGTGLDETQVEILRRWIAEGARP